MNNVVSVLTINLNGKRRWVDDISLSIGAMTEEINRQRETIKHLNTEISELESAIALLEKSE